MVAANSQNFAQYDPVKATEVLKDRFADRSVALGIDLKTGAAGYATLTHASNATFDLDRRKLLEITPNPGTGVRTAITAG